MINGKRLHIYEEQRENLMIQLPSGIIPTYIIYYVMLIIIYYIYNYIFNYDMARAILRSQTNYGAYDGYMIRFSGSSVAYAL